MAQGRKTRCILFTPLSQLPTLLVGLSVTELFILCPALPFLSDTHYVHALFPPHIHTHTLLRTPTNPNKLYYRLGIYIAFRVKKQPSLSLGAGLHRSCAQAALYGCTVVRPPHTKWAQDALKAVTHTGNCNRGHVICFFCILMNEQTGEGGF